MNGASRRDVKAPIRLPFGAFRPTLVPFYSRVYPPSAVPPQKKTNAATTHKNRTLILSTSLILDVGQKKVGHTHTKKLHIWCIYIYPYMCYQNSKNLMYHQGKFVFYLKTKRFRERDITPMCTRQLIIFYCFLYKTSIFHI